MQQLLISATAEHAQLLASECAAISLSLLSARDGMRRPEGSEEAELL